MPKASPTLTMGDGFHVLPMTLPALPALPHEAVHYLYVRAERHDASDPRTRRALFLLNVPVDASEALVKNLLGPQLGLSAGRVAEVWFEDGGEKRSANGNGGKGSVGKGGGGEKGSVTKAGTGPAAGARKRKRQDEEAAEIEIDSALPSTWDRAVWRSHSSATVVFVDRESMKACLEAVSSASSSVGKANGKPSKKIVWGLGLRHAPPELGSKRYLKHQTSLTYPDRQDLIDCMDAYMSAYRAREEAQTRAAARRRSEPDADGFVTVTRGGRTGAARKEVAEAQLERQKKKNVGFEDFYRFQAREKMKQRAGELVKSFEADREKIRKMREQRGMFRPE